MSLEAYLENTEPPWDCTDASALKKSLLEERHVDIRAAVRQLDRIFSVFVMLETEYAPDFISEEIRNHSSLLWADLKDAMPTYRKIQKARIEKILKNQWQEEPNPKKVDWAYRIWIKTILSSKIDIIWSFLTKYFKDHPEDPALPEAIEVAKKHICGPYMEEAGQLISFISIIAPQEAENILKKVLEDSENESFRRSVQDYLRMIQQHIK